MSFPGQQYRHGHGHHQSYNNQQQQSYGPPPQQQQFYAPPPMMPPQPNWGPPQGGYGPPPGPPSMPAPYYQQGSGGFAPNGGGFSAPAGPPPMHYGQQSQGYDQGPPPQYANMPVHYQPEQQNYGGSAQMNGQQGGQFFQYSDCSGRRKALCIGINYRGQRSELRGCVNDAINMQQFLIRNYNFKEEDMVMLLDADTSNARQIPTRANMIAAMQWLVRDARPNDSLFFHYSGHGGQTKDLDGDEDDGTDETVYPLDHERAGMIVDDEMHDIMVRPLPAGCRLTAIFDSCHSATALDLPYIYSTEGVIKEPNLLADAGSGALTAATSYLRGDMGGVFSAVSGFARKAMSGNKAEEIARRTKTSAADVISWSGCKDSQTSADTTEAGRATGAMSFAFITCLTQYPRQSYIQLLNSIRDVLKGKYSQKPQLSASHPQDMNLLFII